MSSRSGSHPELLAGAMEDYWSPIVLGAAENELWTEVAGLFRADDMKEDRVHTQCHGHVPGL